MAAILLVVLTYSVIVPVSVMARAPRKLVGIGDSIGEGVQAFDASWRTQVYSYLNFVNNQMEGDLTLPFIQTSALAMVGDTSDRSRIFPRQRTTNLAVSGATINSILYESADSSTTDEIDSEVDLVLFPRTVTQIEAAEELMPEYLLCWIGNNDVLSTVISWDKLDASQLTPVSDFERDFAELADRISAMNSAFGTRTVFANIPNVTDIGYVIDREAAEAWLGFPVDLPDGHYTSMIALLLMSVTGNDDVIADPDFVLDSDEITIIQERLAVFNSIIQREAGRIGMPVVDLNARFAEYVLTPPTFAGIPATRNLLGGLFSLDGVHPSNIGQALVANEFIEVMNENFGLELPILDEETLTLIFLLDPSIDKDGDGQVTGRPGAGLVETLMLRLGYSGDPDDSIATVVDTGAVAKE